MAVKKVKENNEVINNEVINNEVEVNNENVIEGLAEDVVNNADDVVVNIEEDVNTDGIEVDEGKADVDVSNKPNGNVKIRMRVDHKCCIAMERYDLKANKTYTVPMNVKNILNKAGYLAPL